MSSPRTAHITGEDQDRDAQAVRYEWSTIGFQLLNQSAASSAVDRWAQDGEDGGIYLGAWTSENGRLGRIWVLRRFPDSAAMLAARERLRVDGHPLASIDAIESVSVESFAPLPFMPLVETGTFGPAYEIRDYRLVPGGLTDTIAGWRKALPLRNPVDPITVVMYALDGPDRLLHIWPFKSPNERLAVRREVYEVGIWPPPGAPDVIRDADSTMAWPLPSSPLQ
ncbi:NIPSNAP family protein [Rhodococcus sp. ACPA1]|uniref:NIPSNAP family protein n=1 Tax=Rhodococcus sp. ACPA1 TaxID=2028572 RepID=UPI000BB11FA8|nr:NIPSNAP family protein [Rhodococcus sp. ACPA1]PBC53866.1 NIPSNAP family protein [Rhodococcus sp. ACPA1]